MAKSKHNLYILEIEEARVINEEHRKLNGKLREENKLLSDMLFEMYSMLSQIDFSEYGGELKTPFGESLKYDLIPWDKWETVLDVLHEGTLGSQPLQLRLF